MNRYGKQQCIDMDWNNPKKITASEIAYCLHKYELDVEMVPIAILPRVTKELVKLQKQQNKEQERKLIEAELAIYKEIGSTTMVLCDNEVKISKYSDNPKDVVEYYLDPDLFQTSWEAITAMNELTNCWSHEITKTEEYNHTYKDTDTHSRDVKRMMKAAVKLKQQYIELGGRDATVLKSLSTMPLQHKGTLKQDVDAQRKYIKEHFISLGTSATRAKAIAIAITTEAYEALQ